MRWSYVFSVCQLSCKEIRFIRGNGDRVPGSRESLCSASQQRSGGVYECAIMRRVQGIVDLTWLRGIADHDQFIAVSRAELIDIRTVRTDAHCQYYTVGRDL